MTIVNNFAKIILTLYIIEDILLSEGSTCMKNNKRFGFGIIGCGMIADFHANSILELEDDAELIGVADTVKDAALKFSSRYAVRCFESPGELLACPGIDIVCICTPSGYHADVAVAAARQGKNIIIEKPMGITKDQLDRIERACDESGVTVSSISQSRFSRSVRMARDAIREGRLGRIVCADAYMKFYRSQEYYDSGSWRGTKRLDGGGALMNQGIHGVDLLLYLAGDIVSVYAVSKTLTRRIEVEDTLACIVEYESGATGVIQATTSVFPGYPRRIEINGSDGTIALEETSVVKWDLGCGAQDIDVGGEFRSSASVPTEISPRYHTAQIKDVINALRTGTRPQIDQHEGRRAVDIILAIYRSAEEHRTVYIGED